MGDNSKAMSLEERLVQHIKSAGLAILIDDEDAITELTRRAVREALLQPIRYLESGGYRHSERDSPVIAAAREIAQAAIKKVVDEEVARLAADHAAMKVIREAIVAYLPQAIRDAAASVVNSYMFVSSDMTLRRLRDAGLLDPNKYIPPATR